MTDPCDIHHSRRDLKTFLPVLRDWLESSQAFFEQCQHHEEEPDKEGRMELVVQWDKTYLELVAPDYYFYVLPGSDLVPDLPVPEWTEPVEERPETETQKPKVITTEALALSEPFLIHKVQYVGIQPNSQGVMCKSGVISIQNAGGGSLTGRAFSTHPCIEVNPNRFREKTTLQYWLDEKAIPRDFVPVLVLRSGGDERQVTLAELRPLSRFNTMPKEQAIVITYSPAVFGFIAVNGIIISQAQKIQAEIGDLKGRLKDKAPDVLQESQAHGSYIGGFFLLYAAMAPVASMAIFRLFSHSLQDLVMKHLNRALLCSTLLAIVTALAASLAFPGVRHPEVTTANLLRLTPWAIAFGISGNIYAQLEYERKFAEWVQDAQLRKLIPLCLLAMFLILWTLALL